MEPNHEQNYRHILFVVGVVCKWNVLRKGVTKMKKLVMMSFTSLVMAGMVHAAIEKVDGITWWYKPCEGGVEIISGMSYQAAVSTDIAGDVTIPSALGGQPVVSIGDYAFYSCSLIASVTVPNSVKKVGEYAFCDCNSLESVSLTNVEEIGECSFSGCYSLELISLPKVKAIGYGAFWECSSLPSVTLPCLETIEEQSFEGCSSLTSVSLSQSIYDVRGEYTFHGTKLLSDFPDNALMILDGKVVLGYKGTCPSSLEIPDGVKVIAANAFANCRNLESVILPDGLMTIGDNAFSGTAIFNVSIPPSVTRIGNSAFHNCGGLSAITLPEGLRYIGDEAFYGCDLLSEIEIPAIVTNVGYGVFNACLSLEAVTFNGDSPFPSTRSFYFNTPETLTTYVPYDSTGWYSEYSARLPDTWCERAIVHYGTPVTHTVTFDANGGTGTPVTMTFISGGSVTAPYPSRSGQYSFDGWYDSRDGGNRITGNGTFWPSGDITLYARWNYYGGNEGGYNEPSYAYDNEAMCMWRFAIMGNGTAEIVGVEDTHPGILRIPSTVTDNGTEETYTVTSIGAEAFKGMEDITSFVLPDTITNVSQSAFSGSGITTLTVPPTVRNFDLSTFSDCLQLEEVMIETSYCYDMMILQSCPKLRTLTLPEYLTNEDDDSAPDVDWKWWEYPGSYGWSGVDFWCGVEFALQDIPLLENLVVPENVTRCSVSMCQNLAAIRFPETLVQLGGGFGLWNLDKVVFAGPVPGNLKNSYWYGSAVGNGLSDMLFFANSVYYPAEYADQWRKVLRNYGYGGTHGVYAEAASPRMAAIVKAAPKYATGTTPDFGPFVVGVTAEQTMSSVAGWTMNGVPAGLSWNASSGTLSGTAKTAGTYKLMLTNGSAAEVVTVRIDPLSGDMPATVPSWSVTLNANGGRVRTGLGGGRSSLKYSTTKNKAVGKLPTPTRDGYAFKGWYTKKSGGTKITAKTKVTKNVTWYAQWTVKKYAVKVVKEGKGIVTGAGSKAYKSKVTLKAKPASGYVFAGWWKVDGTDAQERVPPVSQKASLTVTVPLGGVTYKAKFITKAADKAGIGMSFGGVGVGAMDGGQGLAALPVVTNVCGVVIEPYPISASGLTPVSVSVTGLPTGLKYDTKKKAIAGVPTVAKAFTAKITVKSAGASRSWNARWVVTALPAFARGTFNGWTWGSGTPAASENGGGSDMSVASPKRAVTVSVTSAGKISAKAGALSFSRTGWTVHGDGTFTATMRTVRTVGTGKAKKTYTDVLALKLDPEKGWLEDQLAGQVGTFGGNVALADALAGLATGETPVVPVNGQDARSPSNADTAVSARRNPFGDNAEAKEVLPGIRELAPKSLVDDGGTTWKFAVSDKGVATISRTTGTGKNRKTVTATTIVEVARAGDGYSAKARFAVGGKVVEATW